MTLTDAGRDHRILIIDIWYPATLAGEALTQYEPLPGIVFESALAHDQPAMHVSEDAGRYPLVLLSHGRTGMRFAYSLL